MPQAARFLGNTCLRIDRPIDLPPPLPETTRSQEGALFLRVVVPPAAQLCVLIVTVSVVQIGLVGGRVAAYVGIGGIVGVVGVAWTGVSRAVVVVVLVCCWVVVWMPPCPSSLSVHWAG